MFPREPLLHISVKSDPEDSSNVALHESLAKIPTSAPEFCLQSKDTYVLAATSFEMMQLIP